MTKEGNFTQPWQGFVKKWQQVTSPGRPTRKEVSIYEKFLLPLVKNKKQAKVLLLGATPELRDMLAKHRNIKVTLVDLFMDVILAMAELMKNKKTNEVWIQADWLKVPLARDYFDACLGDFVLSNLPQKLHKRFLSNIQNWLKKGGYFISRMEGHHQEFKPLNVDELLDIYSKKPLNLETLNAFWEAAMIFINGASAGVVKTNDVSLELEKYKKGNRFIHPNPRVANLLKKSYQFYPQDKEWFSYKFQDLQKLLKGFFQIQDQEYDPNINFIYRNYCYIYKSRVKK